MIQKIFQWFESRIEPYPDTTPQVPDNKSVLSFIWSNLSGTRGWLLTLTILSTGLGVLSAVLFQFMGKLVDWLGTYTPADLWTHKGTELIAMAAVTLLHQMCDCKRCKGYFLCDCVGISTV